MLRLFSKITFLFLWMLFPTFAAALSVGDAQVRSSLGQPLQVTIPVELDSPEEMESAENLRVSLLSGSNSEAQGGQAQFPPGFLQVAVSSSSAGRILSLTSRQPFLEPVSTIELKVSLGSISIVREVSLLLDPPVNNKAAPAPVSREPRTENAEFVRQVNTAAMATEAAFVAAASRPQDQAATIDRPTAKKPRPQKAVFTRKAEAEKPVLQAASPTLQSPIAIERFKVDTNFASYALLKVHGLLPKPVMAVAALPVETKSASPGAANVVDQDSRSTVPAPVAESAASGGPRVSSIAWLVGLAAIAGLVFFYRRREQHRRSARLLLVTLKRRVHKRRLGSARKEMPARPIHKAREEDNERSTHDDFTDGVAIPVPLAAIAEAANETIPQSGAANEAELSQLRKRIQEVAKRALTPHARSQLLIAEAHVDLRRIGSATSLLDELEGNYEAPKQPERLRG